MTHLKYGVFMSLYKDLFLTMNHQQRFAKMLTKHTKEHSMKHETFAYSIVNNTCLFDFTQKWC